MNMPNGWNKYWFIAYKFLLLGGLVCLASPAFGGGKEPPKLTLINKTSMSLMFDGSGRVGHFSIDAGQQKTLAIDEGDINIEATGPNATRVFVRSGSVTASVGFVLYESTRPAVAATPGVPLTFVNLNNPRETGMPVMRIVNWTDQPICQVIMRRPNNALEQDFTRVTNQNPIRPKQAVFFHFSQFALQSNDPYELRLINCKRDTWIARASGIVFDNKNPAYDYVVYAGKEPPSKTDSPVPPGLSDKASPMRNLKCPIAAIRMPVTDPKCLHMTDGPLRERCEAQNPGKSVISKEPNCDDIN